MPSAIINNVKGNEIPKAWVEKAHIVLDKNYTVIIQPQEERQTLQGIMAEISRNAQKRSMTPEILEEILGEKIKHVL